MSSLLSADQSFRIALTPVFPGHQNFHKGRGFQQWTDDGPNEGVKFLAELLYDFTNALFLQVYLPAVEGYSSTI